MTKEERRKYAVEWRKRNKTKMSNYEKEYRKNHKKEISDNGKKYYSNHKDKISKRRKNYYKNHRESLLSNNKEYQRGRRSKTKQGIFTILGSKCVNPFNIDHSAFEKDPEYIRCLQIDHINGGGTKELRKFKGTGEYFEYILKQLESGSKDYQLLCANCNWMKRWKNNEVGKNPTLTEYKIRGIKKGKFSDSDELSDVERKELENEEEADE